MDKRRRVLTVMLSLTVLVSLTLACSLPGVPGVSDVVPGGEETPAGPPPVETPVALPEGETPVAPPPMETGVPVGPYEANMEALNSLSSYGYAFHFEGLSTTTGAVERTTLDIQGQRQNQPTRAEQLSFSSSDGESSTVEFVYIEDQSKMWTREGGDAWQEVPMVDQSMVSIFDAFSMGFWWSSLFGTTSQDAQNLGQEMVNGVLTTHYRAVEGSSYLFGVGCTWGSSSDDAWVAVDGNFPVKRQLDAGGECQGEGGEVHFFMEITNINQPVSISPPM
jgi:hypothetical protein